MATTVNHHIDKAYDTCILNWNGTDNSTINTSWFRAKINKLKEK